MAELLARLKQVSNNAKKCNAAEIQFLEKSDLSQVLDRGFNEIYRLRPQNPVLFLSKWLSREARARELAKKYFDEEQKRNKLEDKFHQEERKRQVELQKKEEQLQLRRDDENKLIEEIRECKDFWLGFNHICQRLKCLVNATGCYVGIYDMKRKPVTEDDDENGHIHPSNTKVLRYIGWNDDHSFLDGKWLEQNQGVTFDLIFPQQKTVQQPAEGGDNKPDENKPANPDPNKPPEKQENNQNTEKVEVKPEDTVQTLLIEDVVNENRIHFFREPRLGCYLALDLTYKTSLNYNSLCNAIQCTKDYEAAKRDQETRKKEWSDKQEEIKGQIEEEMAKEEEAKRIAEERALEAQAKAAALAEGAENPTDPSNPPVNPPEEKKEPPVQTTVSQSINPKKQEQQQQQQEQENPIEALQKQLTEWTEEPVKLADYEKEETKIYVCLDTLGQDRVFSPSQIKFIKLIGATIRDSLEKLEQSLLEKDRDVRIKFLELEAKIKAQEKYSDEKSEDLITVAINQYYATEEYKSKGITEDDAKVFEGDLVKMKYLKEGMLKGEFKEALETFQEFEFVEFSKIFQNLLYFAKANPLDINELNTNKLEWKRAKKYWSNIFPYILNYDPLGPKPEQVKQIYKLNKIKENLEASLAKRDEVKSYSQTLLMFVDFLLHIIKIRHDDIMRRMYDVALKKQRREEIIKTNAEIDEERKKIIEDAKAANPNVKIPGESGAPILPLKEEPGKAGEEKPAEVQPEGEPKKEGEEKPKEEPPKEEPKKEEEQPQAQPNPQGEQPNPNGEPPNEQPHNGEEIKESEEQAQEKLDELDSRKLAEDLQKYDAEHVKQEIPPEVEYDIDNDYDIEQTEKDNIINSAIQAESNPVVPNPLEKSKANIQKPSN